MARISQVKDEEDEPVTQEAIHNLEESMKRFEEKHFGNSTTELSYTKTNNNNSPIYSLSIVREIDRPAQVRVHIPLKTAGITTLDQLTLEAGEDDLIISRLSTPLVEIDLPRKVQQNTAAAYFIKDTQKLIVFLDLKDQAPLPKKSSCSHQQKPTENQQKPTESQQKPTENQQTPTKNQQKPTESQQKPTENQQTPTKNQQKPKTENETNHENNVKQFVWHQSPFFPTDPLPEITKKSPAFKASQDKDTLTLVLMARIHPKSLQIFSNQNLLLVRFFDVSHQPFELSLVLQSPVSLKVAPSVKENCVVIVLHKVAPAFWEALEKPL